MTQQITVQGYPVRTNGAAYVPRSIQALQVVTEWKYQQAGAPDLWLRMEIAIAFQEMICLRLANTPAVEMLPFTAESWINTVGEGMTEELDRERIKQGFKLLYRTLKWWPQPAELLKVLPLRKPPRPGRTAREATDAQVDDSAGSEALQSIIDMLKEKDREDRYGP